MRRIVFGFAFALAIGSVAIAKDFIVVSSTDPAIRTGQSLDAGVRLPLGAGRSLTLMRPSGEVITVQGGPAGVMLPGDSGAANNSRFAAVQALFAPPPSARTFGAQRGFCPGSEALDNIDAIVRSNQSGCKADARKAFQDYLKAHGVSAQDANSIYANTVVASEGDTAH